MSIQDLTSFLERWNKSTTEIGGLANNRRLYREVLEIDLVKSARSNTLRLNALKSKKRRKGHSSKFMKWLIKQADRGDFMVTACVQPWGYSFEQSTLSKDALRDWFIKYGFKVVWEYPDGKGYEMIRYPNIQDNEKEAA